MAFTVSDCCDITTVLLFVAGMPHRGGEPVAPADALEAAETLAKRAHKSLGAGIDTNEMRRRWPKGQLPKGVPATIVRLLGEYQTLLESTIETATVTGTGKTMCREDARAVADAQRHWREAEEIVKLLTAKPARKPRKAAKA